MDSEFLLYIKYQRSTRNMGKKATLNIGTKLTIRKPFFKIVYGQNPTQEGTEMTFSFYDLGSFTPYGFNPGASEFEIDGKTAVPINIENANEDSLFSVKLSSDATYRFKWAIGSKSYTLDKKRQGRQRSIQATPYRKAGMKR